MMDERGSVPVRLRSRQSGNVPPLLSGISAIVVRGKFRRTASEFKPIGKFRGSASEIRGNRDLTGNPPCSAWEPAPHCTNKALISNNCNSGTLGRYHQKYHQAHWLAVFTCSTVDILWHFSSVKFKSDWSLSYDGRSTSKLVSHRPISASPPVPHSQQCRMACIHKIDNAHVGFGCVFAVESAGVLL